MNIANTPPISIRRWWVFIVMRVPWIDGFFEFIIQNKHGCEQRYGHQYEPAEVHPVWAMAACLIAIGHLVWDFAENFGGYKSVYDVDGWICFRITSCLQRSLATDSF